MHHLQKLDKILIKHKNQNLYIHGKYWLCLPCRAGVAKHTTVWRVNFEGGKFRGFRKFYSILEILTTKVSNFSTIQFLHQLRHSTYVGIHEIHEPLVKIAHLIYQPSHQFHVTCARVACVFQVSFHAGVNIDNLFANILANPRKFTDENSLSSKIFP